MDWIDAKYVNLLSNRLNNFKLKPGGIFNFTCPLPECEDGKTNKKKSRGYVLSKGGKYRYYCHKCSANMPVSMFIKEMDDGLYRDYVIEKLKERGTYKAPAEYKAEKKKEAVESKVELGITSTVLNRLKKVSQLAHDHPAKLYVESRRIPTTYHYKLFYCPRFKSYVNSILPGKFESIEHDEPRLIIPLFGPKDEFYGFQGRSFKKDDTLKYITILLDDNSRKVYNLETVNFNKRIKVFEGPIDAMFITNTIATLGGSLIAILDEIGANDYVIVYDNEPRSKFTVKKMEKAIEAGYPICIWPDNVLQKDVNLMITKGKLSVDQIEDIIKENTFQGLQAQLRMSSWKKI